ncbi:PIN domain-containing protein [Nonomuraea sp. JJY05]|uniref:PIN domain-containing protein n=1 Tax=Nonomuraea sp. JJY05 TaxID=3350255 RepID=UPI00373FB7A8
MADLDSAFQEYYPPTDEQRRKAVTESLVCLDTNVLLDAYRFAPTARNELLSVLAKLGNRLWIPHQVASEFHRNRIKVMGDQANGYSETLRALKELEEHFRENVASKVKGLRQSVALSEAQEKAIIEPLTQAVAETSNIITGLMQDHGVSLDMISEDPVLGRLEALLKGKVGEPPNPDEKNKDIEEAKRRANEQIPPGYADKNKSDASGDYLVWAQILRESARRGMNILLVTRDVKEDWFRREKGRTLSARPELIREAHDVAHADLVIMETKQFLFHTGKYLDAAVSDDLIRQLETMPTVDRGDTRKDEAFFQEEIDLLAKRLQAVNEIITPKAAEVEALIYDEGDNGERRRQLLSELSDLATERERYGSRLRILLMAQLAAQEERRPNVLTSDLLQEFANPRVTNLATLDTLELRRLAEGIGIVPARRMRKSQLINAILERVQKLKDLDSEEG